MTPVDVATGPQIIQVTDSSPFVTGMRARIVTGSSSADTKFVEGRVGIVRQCLVALEVDRVLGARTMKRNSDSGPDTL